MGGGVTIPALACLGYVRAEVIDEEGSTSPAGGWAGNGRPLAAYTPYVRRSNRMTRAFKSGAEKGFVT